MTKLEQLNAAYAASTQGEWSTYAPCSGQDGFPDNYSIGCDTETRSTYVASVPGATHYAWSQNNAKFIALAHNMMPDLLEAVDLLRLAAATIENEYPESDDRYEIAVRANELLEKLK